MIQLGPLKLNSVTSETPIGVKSSAARTATGIPFPKAGTHKLRLNIRLHIKDPTYHQLVEMGRNSQIAILPLYSGYEHIDGLYVMTSLREGEVNWLWANFEILLERASHYFLKYNDVKLRDDDWNIMFQERFEEGLHRPTRRAEILVDDGS